MLAARTEVVAKAEAEAAKAQLEKEAVLEAISDLKVKNATADTRAARENAENLKTTQRANAAAARSAAFAEALERGVALASPAQVGALDFSKRLGVVCTSTAVIPANAYETYFKVNDGSLNTQPIREFAACYRKRAGEIQRRSDVASWTTGAALVGLLVAGNTMAPKKTKVMWTSAAIVPLILNDLRGSGYRAQLYSAGADALDQVALRYDLLASRLQTAESHIGSLKAASGELGLVCADLADSLRRAKTLPDTARRTTVIEGVQAVSERCDAAAKTSRRLSLILSGFDSDKDTLQLYATNDASRVAARMDLLQRALRASPFEVFRSIAKLPFATVEALISGNGLEPRGDPRSDLSYLVAGRRINPDAPAVPDELESALVLSQAFEQALAEYQKQVTDMSAQTLSAKDKKAIREQAESAGEILETSRRARRQFERTMPILNEARLKTAAVLYWDREAIPSLDPRLIDKRNLSLSTVISAAEEEADAAPKAAAAK